MEGLKAWMCKFVVKQKKQQVAASATATESQRQWRAVLTGAERCLGNVVVVGG